MGVTKDKRLRKIYKISEEEFNQSIKEQGGGCAICHRSFKKFLAFQDHFHGCCPRRKKIYCGRCTRGQLCYICNKFIVGYLEKQKIDVNTLAAYINKWNAILSQRGVVYAK